MHDARSRKTTPPPSVAAALTEPATPAPDPAADGTTPSKRPRPRRGATRRSRRRRGVAPDRRNEHDPAQIRRLFETGDYAYRTRMRESVYEEHLLQLQRELVKAQRWGRRPGSAS